MDIVGIYCTAHNQSDKIANDYNWYCIICSL